MSLVLVLPACSSPGSRPAPLRQEVPCEIDTGCNTTSPHYPVADAATGDAAACLFSYHGDPRDGPAEGVVVELDDPRLPFDTGSATLRYKTTTPLSRGHISVEIERDGCGLATAVTKADGSFSVDGTAKGNVSIRLVPLDRPDLITTIHHLSDTNGIHYPILTRSALDGIYAELDPGAAPDPGQAQIVVTFIDPFTYGPTSGATLTIGGIGTPVYDGAAQSGALGLGAVLNGTSKSYPGETINVTEHSPSGQASRDYVSIAQGAVSLVIAVAP